MCALKITTYNLGSNKLSIGSHRLTRILEPKGVVFSTDLAGQLERRGGSWYAMYEFDRDDGRLIQARSGRWMLQELEASFCTLRPESVVVLSLTDRVHESAAAELGQHQELIRNRDIFDQC